MSPKSCSLATHLNRSIVFDHLRLRADGVIKVPMRGFCPLCQESALEIHWDEANVADWAYCSACEFAGDLIELTAAFYREGIAATSDRLRRLGALPTISEEELDHYLSTHIRRRKDLESFWNRAAERVRTCEPAEIHGPLKTLDVDYRDRINFAGQLAEWIGIANKQELEDLWHPASYELRTRRGQCRDTRPKRGAGPGASRLFYGKGWQDLIVIRCTDLPGRTCGLIIMGREGNREKGDIFYRAAPGSRRHDGLFESGVVMRDQLRSRPRTGRGPKWPGTRFVCTDPIYAVSLQVDAIRNGLFGPLPLIGVWADGESRPLRCWSGISPRTLVFWDPRDDEVALLEAARIGALRGRVNRSGYRGCRTTTEMEHLYKTRKPFLEAIWDELSTSESLEAESFLQRLPLSEHHVVQLYDMLTPELRALADRDGVDHVYSVGSTSFRETQLGWFDARSRRKLVSGVIRVTEILGSETKPERVHGKVTLSGKDWWFELTGAELESRGLLSCLKDSLQKQGCDAFSYSPAWAKNAWEAAMAVSTPRKVEVLQRVGWDSERQLFRLPHCEVSSEGLKNRLSRSTSDGSPLTSWHIQKAVAIGEFDWPRPELVVFWSLVVVTIERLLRASLGLPPRGLLVRGAPAQEYVIGLSRSVGLLTPEYPSHRFMDDQVAWLNREVARHDVPPVLDLRGGRGQAGVASWLEGLGDRAAIILAPELTCLSAMTQERFHLLAVPASWRARRDWSAPQNSPSGLALEWFADVYRRRAADHTESKDLLDVLMGDLQGWLEHRGADVGWLRHLGQALTPAERIEPLTPLRELVRYSLKSLPFGGDSIEQSLGKIGQTDLDEHLRRLNAPGIDWVAAANSIQDGSELFDFDAAERRPT